MIIAKWINDTNWLVNEVDKIRSDNTGFHDYKVWFKDGSEFTVEIKEEEYYWYERTGNLGLDFLSAFNFRNKQCENHWKKNKKCWVPTNEIMNFIRNDIEVSKWGKLKTCDADIQLFYIENNDETVLMIPYDNNKLQDREFLNYIMRHYKLRINKKSDYNLNDNWESAAYFVKPDDRRLKKCKINNLDELKSCIEI